MTIESSKRVNRWHLLYGTCYDEGEYNRAERPPVENKGIVLNRAGTNALTDGNQLAIFRIATFSRFVIPAS